MNIDQLIENLGVDEHINPSLAVLTDIIVDTPDALEEKLALLIATPQKILNTNKFSSLLSDLPAERYIKPLVVEISKATPGQTRWLGDYMYALANLLDSFEDTQYVPEKGFINLLGDWLLNTGGGEISWKAAVILSNLRDTDCIPYYRQGVVAPLFHQARIACLRGLVNACGTDEMECYQKLLLDSDEVMREEAEAAIAWLNSRAQMPQKG